MEKEGSSLVHWNFDNLSSKKTLFSFFSHKEHVADDMLQNHVILYVEYVIGMCIKNTEVYFQGFEQYFHTDYHSHMMHCIDGVRK